MVPVTDTSLTYLSINQYIEDQITLLKGQPLIMTHTTTVNGQKDSALVNFYNMDLGDVLRKFRATDISAVRFLGKYKYSQFEESVTGNQNLMYEATDPEVFTRCFTITVDPTNDRILSIYIETTKKSFWRELYQQLLYVPLKVIQIQEKESGKLVKSRSLTEEYRFLQ